MQIYHSNFVELHYDEETRLLKQIWDKSTDHMTPEQFMEEAKNILKAVLSVKPQKYLNVALNMFYPISPEEQEWLNNEIFTPMLSMGLNKVAIVISQEFITQLGIEQTMEGQEGAKFLSKYFSSIEEAETWILKK